MFMGIASVPGTGSQALDGQIAELLVYNAALPQDDFDSVVSYLNNKYLVPEPSSFVLLGFTGLSLIGWARRRRDPL
jgi:hypothetical protein